jgi:ABC-type bacteriocin/lantibiotic exporter with double-glycine peptidase domain
MHTIHPSSPDMTYYSKHYHLRGFFKFVEMSRFLSPFFFLMLLYVLMVVKCKVIILTFFMKCVIILSSSLSKLNYKHVNSAADVWNISKNFSPEIMNKLNTVKTCLRMSHSEFNIHETERTIIRVM